MVVRVRMSGATDSTADHKGKMAGTNPLVECLPLFHEALVLDRAAGRKGQSRAGKGDEDDFEQLHCALL